MRDIEEAFFNYLLVMGGTLEGESLTDLAIRVYTTDALEKNEFTNFEELDKYIDTLFKERHKNPTSEDITRIKNNIVEARIINLSRDSADFYRDYRKENDESKQLKHLLAVKELYDLKKNPYSFFETRFEKGRRK